MFDAKELDSDCGKLSSPKAPKCCAASCTKCNEGEERKKKSFCNWLRVGQFGRREKCCTYFTVCNTDRKKKPITTCYNTKQTCKWVGEVVTTTKKSHCYWKPNVGGKQKKCCSWTVKCFGEKCYNLRKKCKWTGKVVIEKFNHGCRWVTVGKNARRHQCCKQKKTCVGKECTTPEDFDCKWTGEAVMRNLETRCTWSKKIMHQFKHVAKLGNVVLVKFAKEEKQVVKWLITLLKKKKKLCLDFTWKRKKTTML